MMSASVGEKQEQNKKKKRHRVVFLHLCPIHVGRADNKPRAKPGHGFAFTDDFSNHGLGSRPAAPELPPERCWRWTSRALTLRAHDRRERRPSPQHEAERRIPPWPLRELAFWRIGSRRQRGDGERTSVMRATLEKAPRAGGHRSGAKARVVGRIVRPRANESIFTCYNSNDNST